MNYVQTTTLKERALGSSIRSSWRETESMIFAVFQQRF